MRRRVVLSLLAAIIPIVVSATPVFAEDSSPDTYTTAASTYEALPGKGLVRVDITLKVRNDTPDDVQTYACDDYFYDIYLGWVTIPKTCQNRTRYYIKSTSLIVEVGASKLKVTASGGKAKLHKGSASSAFTLYDVTFPKTWKGQTRTIKASYVIKSGPPRSASTVRMNGAYMNFWGIAQVADKTSVRVVVPTTFATETWGGHVGESTKRGKRTYSSGSITDGSTFFVGVTGNDPDGFAEASLTTASGRDIRIQGWPGDDEWMAAVKGEADSSISTLEGAIGAPAPGSGPITIREVAGGDLGDAYVATYDPDQALARVSEDYGEPGTVAHEMSHAWFNGSLFASTWMSEGYAGWAERAVGANPTPCHEPSSISAWTARSGTTTLDLANWQVADPRATPEQFQVVSDQYDASCALVSSVAALIGDDGMRAVLSIMATPAGAYPGTLDATPGGPGDWRQWLDAVEQQRAEYDYRASEALTDTLIRYGVATEPELAGRLESLDALAELRRETGEFWTIPQAVYRPMAAWDFAVADRAIAETSATIATIYDTSHALQDVAANDNPLQDRLAAATTLGELVEVHQQASAQLASATAVADAIDRVYADHGPIDEIGLIGTDLDSFASAAVDRVAGLDLAGAAAQIAAVDEALAGATASGALRLGAVLGAFALVVLVVIGFWLRRRRRRVPPALAASAAIEPAGPEDETASIELPSVDDPTSPPATHPSTT